MAGKHAAPDTHEPSVDVRTTDRQDISTLAAKVIDHAFGAGPAVFAPQED